MRKFVAVLVALTLLPWVPTATSEDDHRSPPAEPISTIGTAGMYIDEFDDDGNVTITGDLEVVDGRLELVLPTVFDDDFNRTGISPWVIDVGQADIVDGVLVLDGTGGTACEVHRDVDEDNPRVEFTLRFEAEPTSGQWVGLRFGDRTLCIGFNSSSGMAQMYTVVDGGSTVWHDYSDFSVVQDVDYRFRLGVKEGSVRLRLWEADRLVEDAYTYHGAGSDLVSMLSFGCDVDEKVAFDLLTVSDNDAEGTAVSVPIPLPEGSLWDDFFGSPWACGCCHHIEMTLLDGVTGEPVPPFESFRWNHPIEDIHPLVHPSLRIEVRMWAEILTGGYLTNWSISWKEGGNLWMDSYDDGENSTVHGACSLADSGQAFLPSVVWHDDFSNSTGSPWREFSTSGEGTVRVRDGHLWIEGPDTPGERVGVEWDIDQDELDLFFDLMVDVDGPGGFDLAVSTGSGDAFILKKVADADLSWFFLEDGHLNEFYEHGRYWVGQWYDDGEINLDRNGDMNFGGGSMYAGGYHYFGENFTRVRISCGHGFDMHWDNMELRYERQKGQVVSREVTLPTGMRWEKARMDIYEDMDRGWTALTIDVLDGATSEHIPGYKGLLRKGMVLEDDAWELSLRGIDPTRHPSIRLRANLVSFNLYTPVVSWWQLHWDEGISMFMDPFDDGEGVTPTGDAGIIDGRVTTSNLVFLDDFSRHDISPWTVERGVADTVWGMLWTRGVDEETSVSLELPPREAVRAEVSHRTNYWLENVEGPRIELKCSNDERLVFWTTSGAGIEIMHWKGSKETRIAGLRYEYDRYQWYDLSVGYDGTMAFFEVRWEDNQDNVHVDRIEGTVDIQGSIEELVLHSGRGRRIIWDDIRVTTPEETGTAVTNPFTVPTGEGMLWLEIDSIVTGSGFLRMRLEDASSGETVPGFWDIRGFLFDLSGIDTEEHPQVRLRFELTGVYGDIPYVNYYRVFWTGTTDKLTQTRAFEDIMMAEDLNETDILNVREYFHSTLTPTSDLVYELVDLSDPDRLMPRLEGWMLAIDLLERDWYGNATFAIRCTNAVMSITTEPILVVVRPYNDGPVWALPEYIEVVEDEEYVFDVSPYVSDVDNDFEDLYFIVFDEANLTVDGHLIKMLFTEGDVWVTIIIRVNDGHRTRNAELDVWVEANPDVPDIDDPPTIASISALEFDEDTEFILDLAPYVQDPDTPDVDLIVTVDEVNCTVDGLVLTFYFEDVTETTDLEVTIEVSDGNSTVTRMVRIRVWDVPDIPPPPPDIWPPELKEVPVQSFRVNFVKIIDLSPYISDRDTLGENLTLSSTQVQVIETLGLEMAVVFEEVPDENFTIVFTVSDGVHQVDGSFGVVVKEADTDPPERWYSSNAGLLVVIVIIVVLVAVAAFVIGRRERLELH